MDIARSFKEHLKCPITHKLMIDPVTLSDGTVYERTAIRHHLEWQRLHRIPLRSPITRMPLLPMYQGSGAEDEDAQGRRLRKRTHAQGGIRRAHHVDPLNAS